MGRWSPTSTTAWIMTSEAALVLLVLVYALLVSAPEGAVLLGTIVLLVLAPILIWSTHRVYGRIRTSEE